MGAVIIFIIDRKIRATHAFFTILFLLICLSAAPAFGDEAIAPSDSPKTIHYIKHGVPRIRTGLSTEDEWSTLAGPIQPGGEPLLKYKPSEGYDIKALGLTIKPSYTLILQGTPDPNLPPGSGKFGASWNLYLDFAKKIEDYGLIFCQIMSGWGETVAPDLKLFKPFTPTNKPVTQMTPEELMQELEYRRMEADYLKKLEALAQQKHLASKNKSK